jgi:membrane-associated phospholipid phosphatase
VTPRPTLERIWFCYLAAVMGLAATVPGVPAEARINHLLLHGIVLLIVAFVRSRARRSPAAARPWRTALAIGGLPVVFSAMVWLLPAVHPEPYEYLWLDLDRALFGGHLGAVAAPWLPPAVVEVLQVIYAVFYAIPILAGVGAGLRCGAAAFDRALLLVAASFLASYLGYLLVPTLGPKVALAFPTELEGLWLTPSLREAIDAGEANPWDCFPSGHTMLTVTSLIVLWRWNRRWFAWLFVPALLLIASTMLLRYHWAIDVVVGAALAWPVVRVCDWLADGDDWPAAVPGSSSMLSGESPGRASEQGA